jgi:hypothetical protein
VVTSAAFTGFVLLYFYTTTPSERAEAWWIPFLFVGFILLGLYPFIVLSHRIVCTGDSLEWFTLFGLRRRIAKSEIATVEEQPFLQRVVVRDHHGTKILVFGSQLISYEDLLDLLRSWESGKSEAISGNTFYRDKGILALPWILIVGNLISVGYIYIAVDDKGVGHLLLFMGLCLFWIPLSMVRAVSVLSDGIVLHRRIGDRRIAYSSIKELKGGYQSGEFDTKSHVITLKLGRFRKVQLSGFTGGGQSLFVKLEKAWRASRGD